LAPAILGVLIALFVSFVERKHMVNDITQLASPTLVFMLFCYFITLGIRTVLEMKWPALKTSSGWKDFLPVIPVIVGVLCAYIPKYPIPAVFIGSWASKGVWGFVGGALSTWGYGILQAVLKRMFGFDIGTMQKSVRPPQLVPPASAVVLPPVAPLPTVTAEPEKKP
jgi:hypothetical protein